MTTPRERPLILAVDDSATALAKLKNKLKKLDFDLITTQDPAEGLKLAREKQPDCILCDFEMPEINGPTFCLEAKSEGATKNIPIIIVTSLSDKSSILRAISSGADDFTTKDEDVEIFEVKIRAMLRLNALREALVEKKAQESAKETADALVVTYHHEILNPMAIICGYADQLCKHSDEKVQRKAEKIRVTSQRVTDLIKEIAQFDSLQKSDYLPNVKMFKVKKKAG